jgi:alanine racemase
MVDVTGTDARPGDVVEVFGEHMPLQELADKLGTITYEILTSVSRRVQRIYFYE